RWENKNRKSRLKSPLFNCDRVMALLCSSLCGRSSAYADSHASHSCAVLGSNPVEGSTLFLYTKNLPSNCRTLSLGSHPLSSPPKKTAYCRVFNTGGEREG